MWKQNPGKRDRINKQTSIRATENSNLCCTQESNPTTPAVTAQAVHSMWKVQLCCSKRLDKETHTQSVRQRSRVSRGIRVLQLKRLTVYEGQHCGCCWRRITLLNQADVIARLISLSLSLSPSPSPTRRHSCATIITAINIWRAKRGIQSHDL